MLLADASALVVVFLALAVVFVGLAVRDYFAEEHKLSPARKTWLRMSFIFSAVAIGMFIWQRFFV